MTPSCRLVCGWDRYGRQRTGQMPLRKMKPAGAIAKTLNSSVKVIAVRVLPLHQVKLQVGSSLLSNCGLEVM